MTETTVVTYGERFNDALLYAAQLHRNQHRKGTNVPYITHLMAVTALVDEHGGGEDEVIAALLHDAVEDQGGRATLAAIRAMFGDTVADIVAACSDTDETPKPPWRERKQAYIRHIFDLSPSALLVSVADKLHNARSVLSDLRTQGDSVWERFNAPKESQLWYYAALVAAFRERSSALQEGGLAGGSPPLIDELERVVDALLAACDTTQAQALAHVRSKDDRIRQPSRG